MSGLHIPIDREPSLLRALCSPLSLCWVLFGGKKCFEKPTEFIGQVNNTATSTITTAIAGSALSALFGHGVCVCVHNWGPQESPLSGLGEAAGICHITRQGQGTSTATKQAPVNLPLFLVISMQTKLIILILAEDTESLIR